MFSPNIDLDDSYIVGIEELAKQRGFASVGEYLKVMIESQVIAAKIASQVLEEDGVDIRQDLEQGFYEIFTEQGLSEEEFWASLDDEDDEDE